MTITKAKYPRPGGRKRLDPKKAGRCEGLDCKKKARVLVKVEIDSNRRRDRRMNLCRDHTGMATAIWEARNVSR